MRSSISKFMRVMKNIKWIEKLNTQTHCALKNPYNIDMVLRNNNSSYIRSMVIFKSFNAFK